MVSIGAGVSQLGQNQQGQNQHGQNQHGRADMQVKLVDNMAPRGDHTRAQLLNG